MRQVAHICVTLRHSCGRKDAEIAAFRQLFGPKSVLESSKVAKKRAGATGYAESTDATKVTHCGAFCPLRGRARNSRKFENRRLFLTRRSPRPRSRPPPPSFPADSRAWIPMVAWHGAPGRIWWLADPYTGFLIRLPARPALPTTTRLPLSPPDSPPRIATVAWAHRTHR
jgi:hypothetical protein